MSARALVLLFLQTVGEASTGRIQRFMATKPLSYTRGAVGTAIYELCRRGRIERVSRGRYRIAAGGRGETNPPA